MSEGLEGFDFPATVEKVQTMADGAIRVTLDLPEDQEVAAAKLMAARRLQVVLRLEAREDDGGTQD